MALFNKLFFSSSSKRKTLNTSQSQQYLSQFPFDTNQVRVLLYRECDNRGRRLLFDSSAIQKVGSTNDYADHCSEKVSGTDRKSTYTHFTKNANTQVKISDEYSYRHGRPTTDITSIGEMIFGALAMSFRGTALKVHWLQSPVRILCSQVFLSPVHSNSSFGRKQSKDNSGQSLSDHCSTDNTSVNSFSMPFSVCINRHLNRLTDESHAIPVDVPDSEINLDNAQRYSVFSVGDSGYGGTEVWTASVSSCYQYSTRSSLGSVFDDQESNFRKLSTDSSTCGESAFKSSDIFSDGNLQRRISRNISTSFENRTSTSDFIGFIGDNCHTVTNGGSDGCVMQYNKLNISKENHSNPEMIRQRRASGETSVNIGGSALHLIKRAKLGLAVCITMTEQYENEMEQFCCEHIALLETMLCRLRASAENAYINHRNFLQIMLHAWQNTARWITDLFSAPRLQCPIWMTVGNCEKKKSSKTVADAFIKELCWILSFADTKDTNFFISKILTAVLTNHLGWVAVISTIKSKSKLETATTTTQNLILDEVSQKHPYNALWAQIGDLYGAIGNPPKISRTIVYGTEKLSLERLLNILAYFIRCGEVKRVAKNEIFSKDALDEIIFEKQMEEGLLQESRQMQKSSLTRSRTCVKNLGDVSLEDMQNAQDTNNSCDNDGLKKNVMNDIPNVLAFRDSHFVQQELRIGNHLMDTGIERSNIHFTNKSEECGDPKNQIRLTITNPDNVEVPVECIDSDATVDSEVVEAAEIEAYTFIKEKCVEPKFFSFKDFSWNIGPIKDGLSWTAVQKLERGIKVINENIRQSDILQKSNTAAGELVHSNELTVPSENLLKKHASLSDLITANSVGQSERFAWGIEPIKENVGLEEEKHFEMGRKMFEHEKTIKEPSSEVVFVLGDNEALVNIKKSSESLSDVNKTTVANSSSSTRTCNHHKKHSGVKFNFEQYPQIATNYMKNKNLELSNYDFLEKSSKLEEIFKYGPSTSSFTVELPKGVNSTTTSCEECEYCAGTQTLQTPSNATELEFETNDSYTVSSSNLGEQIEIKPANLIAPCEPSIEKPFLREHLKSFQDKAAEKKSGNFSIIHVPTPIIQDNVGTVPEKTMKCGFIPSLFVSVSDHYITDMVLQGTLSHPRIWEINLKHDLAIASRCASFTSGPTENVAIIADMEKWDVRVLSSQTHSLPNAGSNWGTVGMSQLVSTMLETVQAMSNSGISSYECLSYIESKLQEMYLQSEVLAAFLLATEFCSLNTVTSTLNLSANDVPLLLSVASIHSPQVTKKYGVSFR